MNLASRLKSAKQKGEAVAHKHGIESLPVDPIAIAKENGISVQEKPGTQPGVSGMLLRHGNSFCILYATHIKSEGFQRFSIAHELGHYFLPGHPEELLAAEGIHTSHAGFASKNPFEMEADNFAVGLLMPSFLFSEEIYKHKQGFTAVEALASLCKTSLSATAIRYVELSEDAVAAIVSTGQKIDYCCLSETMKSLKGRDWLSKDDLVPTGTCTAEFNTSPENITSAEREFAEIDIRDWFGGTRSVEALEKVVGLGKYGKTLTILSCPSLVDEAYEDEEESEESDEAMLERWTPRFRH